jgi:hypothetical protein
MGRERERERERSGIQAVGKAIDRELSEPEEKWAWNNNISNVTGLNILARTAVNLV